jgi:hypothetical protein
MHLRLDGLPDQELAELASSYDALCSDHYPAGWGAFAADMADLLRVELAQRMIAHAQAEDPLAFAWYGRLRPPSPR